MKRTQSSNRLPTGRVLVWAGKRAAQLWLLWLPYEQLGGLRDLTCRVSLTSVTQIKYKS